MAGLRKAKKYDWKDSNMALFGSDLERKVKKESAMCEPAWEGAGTEVGLKIWRVVQFEIKDWDQEYGTFFDGDSYIILNTYKKNELSEELCYDLHFWIGKHSTQDEYGTAAYKTVELDTFLDDKAVQHREVMGHESPLFKSYFDIIRTEKGGADTGFHRVTPEEYRPRLIQVVRNKKVIECNEVQFIRSSLNSGDVFILDMGLQIYQWNGSESSHFERNKAATILQKLEGERPNASTEVLEEGSISESHRFYQSIPEGDSDEDEQDSDDEDDDDENTLLRLSDESGSMKFDTVKTGDITMDDLGENDVFIFDCKRELFVWCGERASIDEKRNGMTYAHNHLMKKCKHYKPVSVVSARCGKERIEVALTA